MKKCAAILIAVLIAVLSGCSTAGSSAAANVIGTTDKVVDMDALQPAKDAEEAALGYQLAVPGKGEEICVLTTDYGEIKIRFFPEAAPKAVYNFKALALNGYYDGLTFHRVIDNFMIQVISLRPGMEKSRNELIRAGGGVFCILRRGWLRRLWAPHEHGFPVR